MSVFERNLSILLEDSAPDISVSTALGLAKELDNAKQHVSDLQHKLNSICLKMNSELAMLIRKIKPGLNVAIDKGCCKIGHRSKYLIITPDMEKGIWSISSNDDRFMRSFKRQHLKSLIITNSLQNIAISIIDFFTNYYKSLGEDIDGNGVILIEGRNSTLIQLADWSTCII